MHIYWTTRLATVILVGMIASIFFGAVALANDTIIATGSGSNRSLALKDAMRNAIEKKIGIMVDAQTIVRNARVIEDNIYTHAEGFIRNYDILEEWEMNGQYTVKIRTVVDEELQSQIMSKLQKIKIIQTGLNDPRIGILLQVQDTHVLSNEAVENMLIKTLRSNGFSRVIDMEQIDEVKKKQALYMGMSGQEQEAMAMMTQFGVDYMIVGNIRSTKGTSVLDGMFTSVKTVVDLRVFNINTAQIGFADTIIGTGMAIDQGTAELRAIEEAAGNIGGRLSETLLRAASMPWQDMQILVSTELETDTVTNALETVEGIERVFFRSSRANLMIFDVKFIGDTASLMQVLSNHGFQIVDAAANRVQVRYNKR